MTLRLAVAEIPETHLLELQGQLAPDETPRLVEFAAEPHSALAYETRCCRQGKAVNTQGRVQVQLKILCDRCLEPSVVMLSASLADDEPSVSLHSLLSEG